MATAVKTQLAWAKAKVCKSIYKRSAEYISRFLEYIREQAL